MSDLEFKAHFNFSCVFNLLLSRTQWPDMLITALA